MAFEIFSLIIISLFWAFKCFVLFAFSFFSECQNFALGTYFVFFLHKNIVILCSKSWLSLQILFSAFHLRFSLRFFSRFHLLQMELLCFCEFLAERNSCSGFVNGEKRAANLFSRKSSFRLPNTPPRKKTQIYTLFSIILYFHVPFHVQLHSRIF